MKAKRSDPSKRLEREASPDAGRVNARPGASGRPAPKLRSDAGGKPGTRSRPEAKKRPGSVGNPEARRKEAAAKRKAGVKPARPAEARGERKGPPHKADDVRGERPKGPARPSEVRGERSNARGPARPAEARGERGPGAGRHDAPRHEKPAPAPKGPARTERSRHEERRAPAGRPEGLAPPAEMAPKRSKPLAVGPQRSGRVALMGRPNVGKSTILNASLEQPLAIVSPIPQTTRDALLGVVHHGSAELAILDTPGLHRPRTELGRVMNHSAREAARSADVVVFVVEVPQRTLRKPKIEAPPPLDGDPEAPVVPAAPAPRVLRASRDLEPHPGDLTLLADLSESTPTVLVINKVDRAKNKSELLPLLDAYMKVRNFAAVVPVCALKKHDVPRILDEVAKLLPEAPWAFGEDEITDRPMRYFAAEYVREQILRATQKEVPHAVAVTIDRFVEPTAQRGTGGQSTLHIDATIHVERPGQKRILIGTGGDMLKRVGTYARLRLEELVGGKVNLKLWVRITEAWRESRKQLEELGYGTGTQQSTPSDEDDGMDGLDFEELDAVTDEPADPDAITGSDDGPTEEPS